MNDLFEHADLMKMAIEEAAKGVDLLHGGPFGALIVKENKIVGCEHNSVIASKDPTAHAEIMAIRSACKTLDTFNLSGSVMYTTCYPCPMCLGAILWARISKVYYCVTPTEAATTGFDDKVFYDIYNDGTYLKELLIVDDKESEACKTLMQHYKNTSHENY